MASCSGCGKPSDNEFCLDCEVKRLEGNKTPSEELRMRANEVMLNSKGFILFVVDSMGALETVGDTTKLTTVEQLGLEYYMKQFEAFDIDEEDEDDEIEKQF